MLTKLREPFGKAGLIVAVVALIAALGGGAYAASSALSGKQKKEVEKIAKKYAGKPGARGPSGPTGPAGANGKDGTDGSNGAPGVGTEGKQGIQGEEGPEGPEGSPWTLGGTLPKGATETGTWAFTSSPQMTDPAGDIYTQISFTVPLAEELGFGEGKVHYAPEEGDAECEGTVEEPSSPEGELCIYEGNVSKAEFASTVNMENATNTASKSGTVLKFKVLEERAHGYGSWAVTGG